MDVRPGTAEQRRAAASDVFEPVDDARSRVARRHAARRQSCLPRSGPRTSGCTSSTTCPRRCRRAKLAELDAAFPLTGVGNSEIAFSWLRVAIRNDYEPAWPRLENYLTTIGRRKLIKPLYEDLMKTPAGAERARAIYAAGAA